MLLFIPVVFLPWHVRISLLLRFFVITFRSTQCTNEHIAYKLWFRVSNADLCVFNRWWVLIRYTLLTGSTRCRTAVCAFRKLSDCKFYIWKLACQHQQAGITNITNLVFHLLTNFLSIYCSNRFTVHKLNHTSAMFLSKSNAADVSLHPHKLLQTLVYAHISTHAPTQILREQGDTRWFLLPQYCQHFLSRWALVIGVEKKLCSALYRI